MAYRANESFLIMKMCFTEWGDGVYLNFLDRNCIILIEGIFYNSKGGRYWKTYFQKKSINQSWGRY